MKMQIIGIFSRLRGEASYIYLWHAGFSKKQKKKRANGGFENDKSTRGWGTQPLFNAPNLASSVSTEKGFFFFFAVAVGVFVVILSI